MITLARHAAVASFILVSSVVKHASAKGFREWQPNAFHAEVPPSVEELARLYMFPSVEEMEHWLLMTEWEIIGGRGEDEVEELMDGRFVCDETKKSVPQLGRVTRDGDLHVRGTNLGGHLVLEPWITPSLFYQFLGVEDPTKIGMDTKTFCSALGEEEGNRQLRNHWENWVKEEDIATLAQAGIDTLRVPVGDWQFAPYDPYINCTAGANEELTRVLDLCAHYNIDVLLDMHALKGSMNGLDNSGEAMNIEWLNNTHFKHWPVQDATWIGHWDAEAERYTSFDFDNFQHSLEAFKNMVDMYATHPAVVAFQPVNEPWSHTPPNAYQLYVWTAYNMLQIKDSNLGLIIHDSFRGGSLVFWEWMVGCKNIVSDIHLYTAWDGWWMGALDEEHYIRTACSAAPFLDAANQRLPQVVGEWSLATDNCAMWLNGFNDNPPGFPQVECDWVPCPDPYLPDQPNAPPDPTLGAQFPIGTGFSTPVYGMCPIDKSWAEDDAYMLRLARAKIASFEKTSGWFFWNFKTELEPKWSFIEAWRRGWLPDLRKEDEDVAFMEKYINNVCDETWLALKYLKLPTPLWVRVLQIGSVAALGALLFAAIFAIILKKYRRTIFVQYDGDSGKPSPKRVQSMPAFRVRDSLNAAQKSQPPAPASEKDSLLSGSSKNGPKPLTDSSWLKR